ncbi:MAG: hypothetical protein OHK0037_07790 [Elainellaceae cyanobacterium]
MAIAPVSRPTAGVDENPTATPTAAEIITLLKIPFTRLTAAPPAAIATNPNTNPNKIPVCSAARLTAEDAPTSTLNTILTTKLPVLPNTSPTTLPATPPMVMPTMTPIASPKDKANVAIISDCISAFGHGRLCESPRTTQNKILFIMPLATPTTVPATNPLAMLTAVPRTPRNTIRNRIPMLAPAIAPPMAQNRPTECCKCQPASHNKGSPSPSPKHRLRIGIMQ